MLREITINNFRNLKNVSIEPSLITLLIGPNNSGKSGIFHSLLVLQQSFSHDSLANRLEFSDQLINLGSRKEVVFEHDESNDIEIFICGAFNATSYTEGEVKSEGIFTYKAISSQNGNGFEMLVNIDDLSCQVIKNHQISEINSGMGDKQANFNFLNQRGIGFNLTTGDDKLRKYLKLISTEFVSKYLNKLFFVPVPRGIGEFKTETLNTKSRQLMTSLGVSELTKNLLSSLAYDNDLVDKISTFMEKLFGKKIRYSLLPSTLGLYQGYSQTDGVHGTVDFYDSKIRAFASNTGFGSNQILFMFTQLLDCPKGSTVLIEEPEISLHPSAQKELVDILIEIAKSQNKQLIISSHSEHIAFALFRARDEGTLGKEELSVYSFTQAKDSKYSSVEEIENLHDSLKAFLGNDPSLILQYIEAFGKKDEWLEKGTVTNS